jgi:hypothetical protein
MRSSTKLVDACRRTARLTFGVERLRPDQESAMIAVLEGHDALVVLPTGFGKSLIYERDEARGITVAVTPERFRAGAAELVAKLRLFRYEGERGTGRGDRRRTHARRATSAGSKSRLEARRNAR